MIRAEWHKCKNLYISFMVEGNGEAEGIGTYSIGEYAKVSASAAEGEEFLGWYESGTLVSSQTEYRFCVKKDAVLKAKFTNHIVESEKEQPTTVQEV